MAFKSVILAYDSHSSDHTRYFIVVMNLCFLSGVVNMASIESTV